MAQKTFNNTKINVEFDEATSRQQLNSGENISTLFGKVKKIFSDLKAVCFSGSYIDLSDIPTTATTEADGLMSASDKTKLDNADDTYALKSLYGDTTINVGRKAGTTVGSYSTAEGVNTTASGIYSHAEGYYTTASGGANHAEGYYTTTSGNNSHAEGWYTTASGNNSHAEGSRTTASDGCAHAEGYKTTASSTYSHAEGSQTIASGDSSHAEGNQTTANSHFSHAEGWDTTTNGGNSCHAEGYQTTASGFASHVEGRSNNKVIDLIPDFSLQTITDEEIINTWNTQQFSLAHGDSSHVEGSNNLAFGGASHAEGTYTIAMGKRSHTSGCYTKALHDDEAAYGKYNVSNEDTLFSIGDGTADDARHNAFEITTTGGKLHDKNIVTDDMSLPANGGNADTVDSLHATDFAMARNSDLMTLLNGQSGDIRALVHQLSCGGYIFDTNYPQLKDVTFPISGAAILSWFPGIFNVNNFIYGILIIRPMTSTGDTYICSVYNTTAYTEWEQISTTPIKKMSFSSVAIYEGGGGILFSIDHGTPIAIGCTSLRAVQCTPFIADNTWYVLAKDATTLDPVPQGSYSFDVWYI